MACGGVVHQFWNNKGVYAVFTLFIDGAIIVIPRADTAPSGSQNNARCRGQVACKGQTRLANRLFCGQQRELGKAIIKGHLLAVEFRIRIKIAHLTTDFDGQTIHVAKIKRANSTAALAHRLKRLWDIVTKCVDRPCPSDHNTFHDCSATNFSIPAIIVATDEISKSLSLGSLALKGT